jgi:hypothetical protein
MPEAPPAGNWAKVVPVAVDEADAYAINVPSVKY